MGARVFTAAATGLLMAMLSAAGVAGASHAAEPSQGYAPEPPGGGTVSMCPGPSQTFDFASLADELPSEDTSVTFTLSGAGLTDASLASVASVAPTTIDRVVPRDAARITVTLPDAATGSYPLTAVGTTSGTPLPTTTITAMPITSCEQAAAPAGVDHPSTGENQAALVGVWIGGGVLVLAGAALVVGTAARRRRLRD